MAVNVEELLVAAFNAERPAGASVEGFMDVPGERPLEFVTFERAGGPRDTHRDLPLVAAQVWAQTRHRASVLAGEIGDWIESLAITHPLVARVDLASTYNNPDPDSRQARYQISAQIVTKA